MTTTTERHHPKKENPPSHKRTESIMCLPNDEQRIQIENMAAVVLEDWEMEEEEEEEPEEEETAPTAPPARPFYDWEEEDSDDESTIPPPPPVDWEQRFYMQRNSATTMLDILKASMRYMRVDIHKIEDDGPWTETIAATTAAMRYRLEHMERVIEAYEESDYFTLYRLTPRRLFDIDDENDDENSE